MVKWLYTYLFDRYSEWELEKANVSYIKTDKENGRIIDMYTADEYRRFDKIKQAWQRKQDVTSVVDMIRFMN
ncbi:MAG TPA: hypothetical protein VGB63_16820 [Pedobacter sp.]|jgi:hypothetical protein